MRLLWVGLWLVAAIGCSQAREPSVGSETHFLSTCEGSCGEPYTCVCGVCTLPCEDDSACLGEARAAVCGAPNREQCGGGAVVTACTVNCGDDASCQALGEGYRCVDRRCQVQRLDPNGPSLEGNPSVPGTFGPFPSSPDPERDLAIANSRMPFPATPEPDAGATTPNPDEPIEEPTPSAPVPGP